MTAPSAPPKFLDWAQFLLLILMVWLIIAVLPPGTLWVVLGLSVPTVLSIVAWANPRGHWKWRLKNVAPGSNRRRVIASVIYTIFITSLYSIAFAVAGNTERQRIDIIDSRIYEEGTMIQTAASAFAVNHGHNYPSSPEELKQSVIDMYNSGSKGPETDSDAQQTLADLNQFDYYGSGLNTNSPPGIVVIATRGAVFYGGHVLITNDDQQRFVGPNGFLQVQQRLKDHVPISEWKK